MGHIVPRPLDFRNNAEPEFDDFFQGNRLPTMVSCSKRLSCKKRTPFGYLHLSAGRTLQVEITHGFMHLSALLRASIPLRYSTPQVTAYRRLTTTGLLSPRRDSAGKIDPMKCALCNDDDELCTNQRGYNLYLQPLLQSAPPLYCILGRHRISVLR